MALITRENAPIIQSLLNSVSMEKPDLGCTVKVVNGKYRNKIGVVEKHILSRFERPFRYGNEMSHYMIQTRGRHGYAILIRTEDNQTFWTKADNVILCVRKEW